MRNRGREIRFRGQSGLSRSKPLEAQGNHNLRKSMGHRPQVRDLNLMRMIARKRRPLGDCHKSGSRVRLLFGRKRGVPQ